MRIAALYDIHGNLPALEGVLGEMEGIGVDAVVVGGDVLPGPMGRETLERLLGLKIRTHFLRGNGEIAVLEELAGQVPAGVPEAVRPVIRWTAEEVGDSHAAAIRAWPATVEVNVDGFGDVLFCHATPRNATEIFTERTTEERLRLVFEGVNADVVVCGHTHMQFERRVGDIRVVNAGSVGMPFGKTGAEWLVLGPDVEFRHITYDLEQAAAQVRRTNFPGAEQFAVNHVLNSPAAQTMLEMYSRVELR